MSVHRTMHVDYTHKYALKMRRPRPPGGPPSE